MPRTRSKMAGKKESDVEDQEDIPLTSWLNLYHGFISDTADILRREIDTIKNVKISKNEAILKNEKKPEAVRLMKNIVTSFNDSIGKAVKDLQAHGAQMTEDLQKRFNLPEDWLQYASPNVSIAGSVINGPISRNRTEMMENRLEFLLGDGRGGDEVSRQTEDNEVKGTNNPNPSEEVADNAHDSDNSSGSTVILTPSKKKIKIKKELDAMNNVKGKNNPAEPVVENELDGWNSNNDVPDDTVLTPSKKKIKKEKDAMIDVLGTASSGKGDDDDEVSGQMEENDVQGNDNPSESVAENELGSGNSIDDNVSDSFLTPSKKKSKEQKDAMRDVLGTSSSGKGDDDEVSGQMEENDVQGKDNPSETVAENEIDCGSSNDDNVSESILTPSKKRNKEKLKAVRDVFGPNSGDEDEVSGQMDENQVKGKDKPSEAVPENEIDSGNSNDDNVSDSILTPSKKKSKETLEVVRDVLGSSSGRGGDEDEVSEQIDETPVKGKDKPSEALVDNELDSRSSKNAKVSESVESKKKRKEELEAMRDVLGSSSSDSESSSRKKNKSPRKRELKKKSEGSKDNETSDTIAKQSWRDDPKLKEDAAKVRLEKLSSKIEKELAEKKYVNLKGYTKMKKCSLDELATPNDDNDSSSDSSSASNDSLHELERQLKKLSRNSIIRTKKYQKTKKETGTVIRRKTRQERRSARGVQDELVSSDSDISLDQDVKQSKLNMSPFTLSNDIVSCSGSEDIDMDSADEAPAKKKQSSRSNPARNPDTKRKTYLQAKISSSDSDSEKRNMKEILGSDSDSDVKKKRASRTKKSKASSGSDSDFITTKKNSSKKKKTKGSDSDGSLLDIKTDDSNDSDSESDSDFVTKKSTKRRRDSSTETEQKQRKKKRRKRIVTNDSDDSDQKASNDSDIEEIPQDGDPSSPQKGRKKIRKIMSNKELAKTTKEAEKEEEERRKRLVEKQKLFNGIHKAPESDKLERLVLDVDPETKEPLVEVDQTIVRNLKPHQAEGIKFMYNACFESVDMIKQGKVPGGCILAHCMGLGKTLQSIAFIHTLLTNKVCEIKTALVICPLSTVNNWFNEFRSWTDEAESLKLHKLYEAKNSVSSRIDYLKTWHRRGGVGILHYDMFRRLADPKGKSKMKASLKQVIAETLLDPGPDIVICDEGHLLKNCKSMLSLAVSNIRTHRRIVLTGTPLQNNLVEYHTMMNFVKPNLLGSLPEFTNRFVNPIKNGQHADSTDYDVKTMKRRAHVLHRKLEGCVQRCDYSILSPYLPPKYEYIIKIKLSEKQELLYKHYLNHVIDSDPLARRRHLLKYYAELVKVWSHPIALTMRRSNKDDEESTSDEGSLKDFIDDDESSSPSASETGDEGGSDTLKKNGKKSKRRTRAQAANDPDAENEVVPNLEDAMMQGSSWWNAVIKSKSEMEDCSLSGKLVVLQEILKTSEAIGDKVLVFSQYLSSLDIIEEFLQDWDKNAERQEKEKDEPITFPLAAGPQLGRWRRNLEYFRIDGQTKVQDRHRDCEKFNKKSSLSKAKLFLISTRAGGLGINLYGANRVVIFDASWNPSQDMQSIFRVYRFGQDKPCYIYRLIAQGTMEEKILRRQITKLSLSSRVVDEHQIERHFKFDDVNEMYMYDEEDPATKDAVLAVPKDRLLADLVMSHRDWIRGYEEFDSLLENKPDEGLSNEEKELAWEEYRIESERQRQFTTNTSSAANEAATFLKVKSRLLANHPHATPIQIEQATKISMEVIEKIRRLMLLQNNGGNYEHLLNPLKIWLQTAVSPHPPGPPVPNDLPILQSLPQAYYDTMMQPQMNFNQYVPRPPTIRRHLPPMNPMQSAPPQLIQHMSHNFRNIASNTLGGGTINRTFQQPH